MFKYIDIYFILKITYPISTLPEHLHSTIPNTNRMEGCAIYKQRGITGNSDTTNTLSVGYDAVAMTQEECCKKKSGQVSQSRWSKQASVGGTS